MSTYGTGLYGDGTYGDAGPGPPAPPEGNYPTAIFEIAFEDNPALAPTAWTVLTDRLRAFDIRRGRKDELGVAEAGTMSAILSNDDRALDPTNASSPYFPDVEPMRRVRLRLVWEDVTYAVFHGFIESIAPSWPAMGFDNVAEIRAVDLFKSIQLFDLNGPAWPQELSGARINKVLDLMGWSAAMRTIAAGQHVVAEEIAANETLNIQPTATGPALGYIQEVAASEDGLFFIAADGRAVFQDRRYRADNAGVPNVRFGDDLTNDEMGYREIDADYDDALLFNEIIAAYTASHYHSFRPEERVTDTASIARYLKRSGSFNTRTPRPGEAHAAASLSLFRQKSPGLRFPTIQPVPESPSGDPVDFWARILDVEISDRVEVRRRPGGTTITQIAHVEGISLQGARGRVFYRFDLSPITDIDEWVLGVSQLGVDTFVGV